ncbi:hypothetical protein [Nocardia abscessus]|uniref:hypothetical protein n=1 Tax=Nocardia abscessus TaxID=120957 RepID=UPI0012F95026|nr:hypothetical protein [Nocardia abscessus]MCC3328610.1 hypothetical protein [Nocardia abscessus]
MTPPGGNGGSRWSTMARPIRRADMAASHTPPRPGATVVVIGHRRTVQVRADRAEVLR